MDRADDRLAFTPPPQPGLLRGFALALVAHLLLVLAFTLGLRWDRQPQEMSAEAELWSAVPQEAAPPAPAPAPPPPQPQPRPTPAPPPPPPPKAVEENRDAEIALEREKQRKLEEERERRAALERKREAERKREEAERKREEAEKKREEAEKKQALAKAAAEKKRKEDAERKKREEAEKKREEQLQEKRLAQLREENLKRMQGLAGGSGSPSSTGTAARSSGPSDSWAGRIRARVKPNIVFTDNVAGNPSADVEVRLAPDGTIVGKRLAKSSGSSAWDDAVLRALDRTGQLPRDVDGRVHSPVTLTFRPRD